MKNEKLTTRSLLYLKNFAVIHRKILRFLGSFGSLQGKNRTKSTIFIIKMRKAQQTPSHYSLITFLTFVIFLFSMSLGCVNKSETEIILAGSTSVQPYAEVLAEEYALLFPESVIDIQGGGSSAGISAARSGTADIGMSSRALTEKEQDLWSCEIAKDGLAIIIHPENPVENLSLAQVRDIYTANIRDWEELADNPALFRERKFGSGLKTKIHIITREEGSGTRSAFESLVMQNHEINPGAIVQDSNGAVRQLVSGDINAIGFISLGLVDHSVKALKLDGILPTCENVINGAYNLYRPFLFITDAKPEGFIMHFIDYVLSEEGQQVLAHEGLIRGAGIRENNHE